MNPETGREREITLVYGKTGMGKTRWTRAYLRTLRRVIVSDPMLEHDGMLFNNTTELIEHVEDYKHGAFRVRSDNPFDVPLLADVAMAAARCCLVVEESQRSLPSRGGLPPAVENVIYRGRHRHVSLVSVAQRPSTVHIAARSQWTRLIIFQQTEGSDLGWLEEQTGIGEEAFSRLRPGEYVDAIAGMEPQKKILTDQRAYATVSATSRDTSAQGDQRDGLHDVSGDDQQADDPDADMEET